MTIEGKIQILELARKEGADEAQIERLCEALWLEGNVFENVTAKDISVAQSAEGITKIVTNMLHELGIPAHLLGCQYLRTGIILCIKDTKMTKAITKVLYPAIAKEYDSKPTKVERAIRHAIEVAWDRANVSALQDLFGFTVDPNRGRPTNNEFISMLVEKLKLQYNL